MAYSKIGIVLSSGGGRGIYAHTGFLLAIEKLGIEISASTGCSAGAIVGGIAASGANLSKWSEDIVNVQRNSFWTPRSIPRLLFEILVRKGVGLTGISTTNSAIDYCRERLSAKKFEECKYPFHALAVNLGTSEKKIFSSGELAPRMMASAAMPIMYEPVLLDGDYFTDGAIIDLAPTDAICCRHELDVLIVHHVSRRNTLDGLLASVKKPWTMVEILHRIIFRARPWYLTGEPLSRHKCPCGCGAKVFVLEPEIPDLVWPVTRNGSRIIDAARAQALAELKPIMTELV